MKKKRKKQVNKESKSYQKKELKKLKSRCHSLWSRMVRDLAGNRCVFCGDTKYIHAHHIEDSRLCPSLRYDIRNGLSCCASHHKFSSEAKGRGDAVHKSFIFIYDYMTENRPEDIVYLREHRKDKVEITKEYLLKKIKELNYP